jgi:hypothetical protein
MKKKLLKARAETNSKSTKTVGPTPTLVEQATPPEPFVPPPPAPIDTSVSGAGHLSPVDPVAAAAFAAEPVAPAPAVAPPLSDPTGSFDLTDADVAKIVGLRAIIDPAITEAGNRAYQIGQLQLQQNTTFGVIQQTQAQLQTVVNDIVRLKGVDPITHQVQVRIDNDAKTVTYKPATPV